MSDDVQTPTAPAPAPQQETPAMKFQLRVKIGVDGGTGVGITTKTTPFTITANSLEEASQKALQLYVEKYGREPNQFAQFSMTLALDTGKAAA